MRNLWRNGLVLALLLIVGCFDPSDSILEPGSLAVVATEKEYLMFTATGVASLDPGVMVRIGHDPGVYRERDDWFEERVAKEPPADAAISRKRGPDVYPNGTELSKLRDVKVTVESGRHKDASGKITRKDLRPSK